MAHWQATDGTRSSVLAMNQLANILRRAIAKIARSRRRCSSWTGMPPQRCRAGSMPPAGDGSRRTTAAAGCGSSSGSPGWRCSPAARRAMVGAGRLASPLRPADTAVRARAAGELRVLARPDHPAVAAGSGQVAPGHDAGIRRAALVDGQPGTDSSAWPASTGGWRSPSTTPAMSSATRPPRRQAAAFRRWDADPASRCDGRPQRRDRGRSHPG